MTFLAPTWLLALLPWAAFAGWMLVGRRRRQRVPFLALWDAPEELRRPKKGFEPPPVSLLFALLATLLATLALSRPRTSFGHAEARHVTIVLDRGATMSARSPAGEPRFTEAARALVQTLARRPESLHIDLVDVPATTSWSGAPDQLPTALAGYKRTAVDTTDDLRAALHGLTTSGPVLVITDHDLGPTAANVTAVTPSTGVRNVAITALAERAGQVMVTLTTTGATSRTLILRAGDKTVRQTVDFTAPGRRNVFLDLDTSAADVIEVALDGSDDFSADDRAYLVRGQPWPALEPRSPLPDELRRMIDVYRRLRPAGESSARLAIGRREDVKSDEPAVLLSPVDAQESARGEVRPVPHALTAGVDWAGVAQSAALATGGPPEGWTILARVGDRPILAVRDAEPRQAWVGFESRTFARTPGYVVFWTNLFDHLAPGSAGFSADALRGPVTDAKRLVPATLPSDVDPVRWPGVFQTPTGKVAFNAPPAVFDDRTSDWKARIAKLRIDPSSGVDLSPWLALVALGCVAVAAGTWERRRAVAPRTPAHLDVETLHRIESTFNADGHVHRHETLRPPRD